MLNALLHIDSTLWKREQLRRKKFKLEYAIESNIRIRNSLLVLD